jgi:hypothetical protein
MLVNFQMGDKIPHVSECEEKKLFIAPELWHGDENWVRREKEENFYWEIRWDFLRWLLLEDCWNVERRIKVVLWIFEEFCEKIEWVQ